MSRVFEALTKASEEKKIPNPAIPPDGISTQEGLHSLTNEFFPDRPLVEPAQLKELPPFPSTASPTITTWKQRLEELFFGGDLKKYKEYSLVALETDSPAAEQYKILRERLKQLRNDTGTRSTLVTSPVKQDGKTMVAVNLAIAMALDYEEKVLLIDADLRSPEAHKYFGIKSEPGLSDYLNSSSREDPMSMIQPTPVPKLFFIASGKPSHRSSELLATGRMKELMTDIRMTFPDYQIILDTPPVLSTPDPMILAREVEGVIMVIRARKTPRVYLTKAIQALNSNKLLGIVLNGAEMSAGAKYYYYSNNGKS